MAFFYEDRLRLRLDFARARGPFQLRACFRRTNNIRIILASLEQNLTKYCLKMQSDQFRWIDRLEQLHLSPEGRVFLCG